MRYLADSHEGQQSTCHGVVMKGLGDRGSCNLALEIILILDIADGYKSIFQVDILFSCAGQKLEKTYNVKIDHSVKAHVSTVSASAITVEQGEM